MKGLVILLISLISELIFLSVEVSAQDKEVRDTVVASKISAQRQAGVPSGLVRLSDNDFLNSPALLGSPDVIKIIQNLTGVSSGVELLSGLYVHGGDGSDNLFLLDGVPLFQVSHLGGMFSSFNSDIVESVDFYKSGFPAQYGGKLSSVVDLSTKDGSLTEFGGSVSIGFIDGRVMFNGPIIKNKLSYSVALRRSWIDAITVPAYKWRNSRSTDSKDVFYAFYDANVNVLYCPGLEDRINIRYYSGRDRFRYSNVVPEKFYGQEIYNTEAVNKLKTKWGNVAASADWSHVFSENSRMKTSVYYSRGYSDIFSYSKANALEKQVLAEQIYEESAVGNVDVYGVKSHYSKDWSHHGLTAGLEYKYSYYNSDNYQKGTNEVSVFVQDAMKYDWFGLDLGLRLDAYFAGNTKYFRPSPRLRLTADVTENFRINADYVFMSQYSHLLSSLYLDLPTNLWMPSTANIKPVDSHQWTAGVYYNLLQRFYFELAGYYKILKNCLIYSGTTSFFPDTYQWESNLSSGIGRAYGLEFDFRYIVERLECSLGYTLSWNKRKFKELYADWFDDRLDNRHKLTVSCVYKVTDNIDLTASWIYHSGNRVTAPEHVMYKENGYHLLYSKPYNVKMPDYHKLDVGCNIHKRTKRGNEHLWALSVYNLYCRMNPIMMSFRSNDEGKPIAKVYSLIPIIPSFSYTYKF